MVTIELRKKQSNAKILIIASTKDCVNGPSGVIRQFIYEFDENNIEYELLNYQEGKESKIQYLKKLVISLMHNKNCIVNVHTDGYKIPFIVMILSKLNKNNIYYLTIHGIYYNQRKYINNTNKINIIIEKILYKHFDNIICVSEKLKNDIKNLFNRENNVYVINNGVTLVDYKYKIKEIEPKNIKFITTGGIKNIKGIFELLEIVLYLKNIYGINVSLSIYGIIDEKDIFERYSLFLKKNGLEDCIIYKGVINDKLELYKKYEEADINVCMSHYDTFNISVLESMVVGTPTIVSKQCGASYLINNYIDGFIIDMEQNYKNEFISIVDYILNNSSEFQNIRFNAVNNVKKYSWSSAVEHYLRLLKGMIYNNE